MKVTYILKDLDETYYNGCGTIVGLMALSDKEKLTKCKRNALTLKQNVKEKIGNGSFRDKVELNSLLKKENSSIAFKMEPRKGYNLVTFEII